MKEYVLITPNKIKNKIIEIVRIKYYNYNIKFMSLEDFIKKYIFDYNNKTIYYLMKEYDINLSSALVYINNLYYISDKLDNNKMNILKEMKEYLDNNTVEGVYTLKSVYDLIKKKNINAPFICLIYDIVFNGKDANDLISFLRDKK